MSFAQLERVQICKQLSDLKQKIISIEHHPKQSNNTNHFHLSAHRKVIRLRLFIHVTGLNIIMMTFCKCVLNINVETGKSRMAWDLWGYFWIYCDRKEWGKR